MSWDTAHIALVFVGIATLMLVTGGIYLIAVDKTTPAIAAVWLGVGSGITVLGHHVIVERERNGK